MEHKEAPALEARDLSFAWHGGTTVFEHVSFALRAGDVLTILGPNGAGKSTLLNCLGGLLEPAAGEVLLAGEPVSSMDRRRVSGMLGYVSQASSAHVDFPVRDYLVMGRAPYISRLKTPSVQDYEAVERVIEEMGLARLADKSIGQLSGGELQQVRIARVLVQRPRVVMLDEPTNHLDYGNQLKVLETIDRLAGEERMAVLLTTHTPDFAILLGGQCAMLDHTGRLTVGSSEDIVTEGRLRAMYEADLRVVDLECVGRRACVACGLKNRHTADRPAR